MITQTIAEQCANRLMLGRDLKVGPGFKFKEKKVHSVPRIKYFSKTGEPVTRKSIADHYGVCPKHVANVFTRNKFDYKKAHKELESRL